MHFDDVPVAGLNGHTGNIKDQHNEYMERLPECKESLDLGSRLNPLTGETDPRTSKDKAVRLAQCGPVSRKYSTGYDNIAWA